MCHFLSRIFVNQTNQCCCVPSFKRQREQDLGVDSHFISMNISVLHSCCLWNKNTSHSLQITAMRSYQVINLITKWNPVRGSASLLVIWSALFLWSLPQWETIGQTVKKSIEVSLPSCLLRFFFWCRMWHVSGVIFLKCFLLFIFSFLPYSIPCVFTVLCPYTSGIFLFMCNYWSYIIGWVCLTNGKSALSTLRPVYACTFHVQQPLYCF